MENVTLKEMLTIIDSGSLFSIELVSYDKKRTQNNGRVLVYQTARLESAMNDTDGAIVRTSRNTYNSTHFTRNIRLYVNGRPTSEIRKIHPLLVIKFNSKELLL
jgi:hypothetical protein